MTSMDSMSSGFMSSMEYDVCPPVLTCPAAGAIQLLRKAPVGPE